MFVRISWALSVDICSVSRTLDGHGKQPDVRVERVRILRVRSAIIVAVGASERPEETVAGRADGNGKIRLSHCPGRSPPPRIDRVEAIPDLNLVIGADIAVGNRDAKIAV